MKTQARLDRIRAADWRDPRSCGFGCWSGWRTPRTRGSQLLIPPEACGSWRGGREDSSGAGTVSQAPSTHEPLISSETAPAVPAEVPLAGPSFKCPLAGLSFGVHPGAADHAGRAANDACSLPVPLGNRYYSFMQGFDRITIDPAVCTGKPCIRGLRFPVSRILGLLAAGQHPEEILAAYPYLETADIRQALEYAAFLAEDENLELTR